MNRARRVKEYEALGMTLEQAKREATYDAIAGRWDRRAKRWLRPRWKNTRAWVVSFFRYESATLVGLVLGTVIATATPWIEFRTVSPMVLGMLVMLFLQHDEKLALRGEAIEAKRALKRSVMANRVMSGAVESSAEYIVEQRMAYEGHPLGPVVWIDGKAFPVDDEQEQG